MVRLVLISARRAENSPPPLVPSAPGREGKQPKGCSMRMACQLIGVSLLIVTLIVGCTNSSSQSSSFTGKTNAVDAKGRKDRAITDKGPPPLPAD